MKNVQRIIKLARRSVLNERARLAGLKTRGGSVSTNALGHRNTPAVIAKARPHIGQGTRFTVEPGTARFRRRDVALGAVQLAAGAAGVRILPGVLGLARNARGIRIPRAPAAGQNAPAGAPRGELASNTVPPCRGPGWEGGPTIYIYVAHVIPLCPARQQQPAQ